MKSTNKALRGPPAPPVPVTRMLFAPFGVPLVVVMVNVEVYVADPLVGLKEHVTPVGKVPVQANETVGFPPAFTMFTVTVIEAPPL